MREGNNAELNDSQISPLNASHFVTILSSIKGVHPEYEEHLQQLIDKREQTLEKARLYRDYRLECVEKMFDAETRQVKKDYMVCFK